MNSKKTVFTIVATLIVVVMLGVLAVCVAPQFSCGCGSFGCGCGSDDSRPSILMLDLRSIRTQLELYKIHHNGTYPSNITEGLTKKTDADGTINASGQYGPYLREFPRNRYVADPVEAVKTTGAPGEGWDYDPATGVFLANVGAHVGYGDLQLRLERYLLAWESARAAAERIADQHPGHMPRWRGNGYCCPGE